MDRKVAIVTGSRRGIGKAIVIKLAQKGYDIVINDKEDENSVNELVDLIKKDYGVNALGIMADVSEENNVKKLLEEVKKKFGSIEVLINNAAIVEDMELTTAL